MQLYCMLLRALPTLALSPAVQVLQQQGWLLNLRYVPPCRPLPALQGPIEPGRYEAISMDDFAAFCCEFQLWALDVRLCLLPVRAVSGGGGARLASTGWWREHWLHWLYRDVRFGVMSPKSCKIGPTKA